MRVGRLTPFSDDVIQSEVQLIHQHLQTISSVAKAKNLRHAFSALY